MVGRDASCATWVNVLFVIARGSSWEKYRSRYYTYGHQEAVLGWNAGERLYIWSLGDSF